MRQYFREAEDSLQSTQIPAPIASIVVGDYPASNESGNNATEVTMAWYQLGDRLMPRLECYQDAFRAFEQFPELFVELSKRSHDDLQPDQFCCLLDRLGFTDITETLAHEAVIEV